MSRYLMRFIGGKYEGGVVHLPEAGEVGIGRAQELEICLVEDMVSRHHAKLEVHADRVILTDLGSTNGTFVNGERIKMCELENDDRVLFGTSILRLEDTTLASTQAAPVEELATSAQATRVVATDAMSGDLSDVSLTDLLQLLGGNRRTGVLTVTAPEGEAHITLIEGRVGHIGAQPDKHMLPTKILCRMLGWREGQFAFSDGTSAQPAKDQRDLGHIDELLMEATRQNDEAERLWPQLGGHEGQVTLARPLGGALSRLDSTALDLLQLTWDAHGALQKMADSYQGEDSVLLQGISTLLEDGFLQPN